MHIWEEHCVPSKVFVAIQVGVIQRNTFSFLEKLEQKISILTYLQKEIKFWKFEILKVYPP